MVKCNEWPSVKMFEYLLKLAKWLKGQMKKWPSGIVKRIRGKLADFKKPITESSRVENLAKCQTNSKVLDQVKSCLGSSNVSSYSFTFRRPMCQSCHRKIFFSFYGSAWTAFSIRWELISFFKPYRFYEKLVSTTLSM